MLFKKITEVAAQLVGISFFEADVGEAKEGEGEGHLKWIIALVKTYQFLNLTGFTNLTGLISNVLETGYRNTDSVCGHRAFRGGSQGSGGGSYD